MKYKDILIQLASMTVPYVYDDEVSFLELDRKLYKIVHELIVAMQGLSTDYDDLKTYVDDYFKNLNLESEVQTIINQMVDDGTLASIINEELLTEINQNVDKLTSDIETINSSITTINGEINTANTNINTNSENIKTLKNKTQIQNATCEENASYILVNPDFKIEANDVIFTHFNPAINKSADATLTINDVAKNVIKEDGSLYKGEDIENKDLILKVASAGLIQIVDIADLQEQINVINTDIGDKDSLNTNDKSSLVNAINEVNNKSNTNKNDINSVKSFLNLNNRMEIDLSECSVSDGNIDLENSYFNVVTNADKTYMKAYGYIRVENITQPINFINITLPDVGIRPTENITVRPCGNTVYSENKAGRSTTMILKTDGTIDLHLNGSNNTEPSILGYFVPFLIYVENFGD